MINLIRRSRGLLFVIRCRTRRVSMFGVVLCTRASSVRAIVIVSTGYFFYQLVAIVINNSVKLSSPEQASFISKSDLLTSKHHLLTSKLHDPFASKLGQMTPKHDLSKESEEATAQMTIDNEKLSLQHIEEKPKKNYWQQEKDRRRMTVDENTQMLIEKKTSEHNWQQEKEGRLNTDNTSARLLTPFNIADRRPIIYIHTMGRLGNKMFQIATASIIAEKCNRRLLVQDDNRELVELFPRLNITLAAVPVNMALFMEDGYATYDEKFFYGLPAEDVQPCCFFQSWKYFKDKRADIQRIFTPNEKVMAKAQTFLLQVRKKTNAQLLIGVHVRRGDLTSQNDGYNVAPLSYIIDAMQFFQKEYGSVHFVVCTDDVVWCEKNLKSKDVTMSTHFQPIEDFAVLTLCDHLIITVGTFGWWAGYFSHGTVVYYNEPVKPDTRVAQGFDHLDYFLPDWLSLQ